MSNDKMAVHFSSATDVWATPQDFFNSYNEKFSFETDVCANSDNAKCARFFTAEQDGLTQEWNGICWMNPPYGRGIRAWVKKAYESAQAGATVVCLLPARTDTAWWHDYCVKGEIDFIRGRLKFGGHKNSAPFPSAVVVFRPFTAPVAGSAAPSGEVERDAALAQQWEHGVLMAAAIVVYCHDMPVVAGTILNELSLPCADCSELSEFDQEALRKVQGELGGAIKLRGLDAAITATKE